jgi:large subunit ribosomal protein L17
MRHRTSGRQLGRNTNHRRALFRSLVTSLLEHERIETTEAKAKEVRILTDRIITLGKRGDLHARRRALAYVRTREVVSKVFTDLAGRFAERPGGYTRLIKTRRRVGDAARMVVIELLARVAPKKEAAAPDTDKKTSKTVPPASEEAAATAKSRSRGAAARP